jgi:hypothetical protein
MIADSFMEQANYTILTIDKLKEWNQEGNRLAKTGIKYCSTALA